MAANLRPTICGETCGVDRPAAEQNIYADESLFPIFYFFQS